MKAVVKICTLFLCTSSGNIWRDSENYMNVFNDLFELHFMKSFIELKADLKNPQ